MTDMGERQPRKPDRTAIEIRDRTKRIETKLTRLCAAMNVDPGGHKPQFSLGVLTVPSLEVSLREMLELIPDGWDPELEIVVAHNGKNVCAIFKEV